MRIIHKIKEYQSSPIFAVTMASLIALAMIGLTTAIFFKSSAYATVKQIQAGAKYDPELGGSIDTTSPIKATDIDWFAKSFKNRLQSLDDQHDFATGSLSDQSLGLQ